MSVADYVFFCFIAIAGGIACVSVSKTLYAVIWQLQSAVAICGLMACQHAYFTAFSLISAASSIFLTVLMFSLIIFNVPERSEDTPKRRILYFLVMVILPLSEFMWLYFRHLRSSSSFSEIFSLSALGTLLYTRYAICVIVFALVLTGSMVGITMLMMNKKGDGADFRKEEDKDREIKAELRRIPVERKYL